MSRDYLQNLPIFQKSYDLIRQVYIYVPKFPKRQQYILGQRIENFCIDFLGLVVEANEKEEKLDSLKKASVVLNKLRVFVRLAKDLKFLSFKEYQTLEEIIDEIGKMLGGWIKFIKGESNEKL